MTRVLRPSLGFRMRSAALFAKVGARLRIAHVTL